MSSTLSQAKLLWSGVAAKYNIHEETFLYTAKCIQMGIKPSSEISLEDHREQTCQFSIEANGITSFDGSETEFHIPALTHPDDIPITVYKPASAPKIPAIVVYFHGGGLISESRKSYERCLKEISQSSGAIVVNVGYRLLPCPEDPMAPFNDADAVTDWVMKNKETIGGASESKLGVGGDSGGGQIACSVTNDIGQGLSFQVLIYPVASFCCSFPSNEEFMDIPSYNTKAFKYRLGVTNTPIKDAETNPRINPSARTNEEQTPPTLMILAELDPLKDGGRHYALKLRLAKVEVQKVVIEGVPHGFFSLPGIFKTKALEAYEPAVAFIKKFHGQGESSGT